MERLVTAPLEVALAGMPGLKTTFSRSTPGMTTIDLFFDDKIDFDKARQEVTNRLGKGPKLPGGVKATVTASRQFAVEVLRCTLTNPRDSLGNEIYTPADLRALQDQILAPEFGRLPGVLAVSAGGASKRYEIHADPERMKRYGITLKQVTGSIAGVAGAGKDPVAIALEKKTPKDAAAYLRDQEQIRCRQLRSLVITSINNTPVRVDDVVSGGPLLSADAPSTQGVIVGQKKRQSQVGIDQGPDASNKAWRSHDDVVEGIILVRKDHDASAIQAKALARVKEINETPGRLLPGVKLELVPTGERFFVGGNLPANLSLASASEVVGKARNLLRAFPEVQWYLSQLGPDSDGLPLNYVEICVVLKPAKEWPAGPGLNRPRKLAELMLAVVDGLQRKLPGTAWTSSLASAAETPPLSPGPGEIVVKVFGPELDKLRALAGTIEQGLATVKGVGQVHPFVGWGPTGIEFVVDKEKCKHWGLEVTEVSEAITAALKEGMEGAQDAEIVVSGPGPVLRADESSILEAPLDLGKGPGFAPRLKIKDVVSPVGENGQPDPKGKFTRQGVTTVYREDGKRLVALRLQVRGRAAAEVQKAAQTAIAGMVQAPYRVEWAGRKED
jgi:Cu/Ag efflux pump CusA